MKTSNSIDLNYLELTFEGDKNTINIVLQSFIKNTPQLTKELIECMVAASWKEAKHLAHKIKSSFITVGAKRIGDLLDKILTVPGNKNKTEVNCLVKELKELSEQVFSEVNSTIDSYGE
jgi:HPt (histidine-containing phosphotransfer) domain-containing protein